MVIDKNLVKDGIRAVPRGVNSGTDPATLSREYVAFAVNTSCRGGYIKTRPGYKKLEIDYGGNESLQDGLFQGASTFKGREQETCIVALISGVLFRYDLGGSPNTVSNIASQVLIGGNPVFDNNSAQERQAWMLDAEGFLIVQNGLERPLIYDGVSTRRAGDGEIRVGCMMEYSNGRIWVVRPDRTSFAAGDIVYGPSGTVAYNFRDAILKTTENEFLNEGGDFTIPMNAGRINAIRNISILDTSMGQGPLQVLTDRATFSVNAPADRTIWKDLTYPIQTVSLIGNGALSQDGTVSINGDIWYRAKDGIRSLVIGLRSFNELGNVPMSREMNRVIEADDKRLLGYDSAIVFENRQLRTCSPANSFLHGTYHRGLIALDFDIASSMAGRQAPAYDGLWTGVRILKLLGGNFGGVDRAFAFVLSASDKIELWEITANDLFDNMSRRIESFIETPALFDGLNMRELFGGEIWIDELSGRTDFDLKWRPDQYAGWFDWHSWSECANYQSCTLTNCEPIPNLQKQYRSKMRLPKPPEGCSVEDNRPANKAFLFQLRLAWTGSNRIRGVAAHTWTIDEEPYGECRLESPCISSNVCPTPVFSYSAET